MTIMWMCQRAEDVPQGDGWLTRRERLVVATLRSDKRTADWRLGRWTAKRTVERTIDLPGDIEILAAPDGAPEVWCGAGWAPIAISLSHSNGVAVCCAAPRGTAVGCDLELVEPRSDAFVADYFTDDERAYIASAADTATAANLLWSAKEAALKALRCGLRRDTRSVEITTTIDGDAWRELVVIDRETGQSLHGRWCRLDSFVFTIVSDPPGVLEELVV